MTEKKKTTIDKQHVKRILENLTDRERKSLEERFGKIDENTIFDHLFKDFESTRRKIKEIEAKASKKQKKAPSEPPDDIA